MGFRALVLPKGYCPVDHVHFLKWFYDANFSHSGYRRSSISGVTKGESI